MHDVAFVELHVKVPLPPLTMVVGDAVSVTVGAGVVPADCNGNTRLRRDAKPRATEDVRGSGIQRAGALTT